MQPTHFERAIFLNWHCAKGDCKFCYMSTQKNLIKEPKKARRKTESVLAEVYLCSKLGWKIEFLSGGYECYTLEELLELLKNIKAIYGEKLWLNTGNLSKKQLQELKPHIKGVCGAVECINPKLHARLCPSKLIKEIENMFNVCDELNLKKAMTMIIGLGETLDDFGLLKDFIKKHKVNKLTLYRLKLQKGTIFENAKPPAKKYYVEWVKKIRKEFPKLEIVVGSWLTHLDEIHLLLEAGADALTKFPSIKQFNTKFAKKIEAEAKKAGRRFEGTLTKLPKMDVEKDFGKINLKKELKESVKEKVKEYLKKMK